MTSGPEARWWLQSGSPGAATGRRGLVRWPLAARLAGLIAVVLLASCARERPAGDPVLDTASQAPIPDTSTPDAGEEQIDTPQDTGTDCPAGRSPCGDGCVDTQGDPAHCGGCDQPCAEGGVCLGGVCACPGVRGEDCGGVCRDLDGELAHCGGCDSPCAEGQSCTAGACVCPGAEGALCGGACTDLSQDAAHCGDCETVCAEGASCTGGECVCPGVDGRDCGGVCVDVDADPLRCGGCDVACAPGAVCEEGGCTCPGTPGGLCDGVCVDLGTTPDRCGDCETVCPPTATCKKGICTCPGSAGAICGEECRDLGADPTSCGACDHGCLAGDCAAGACQPFPLGAAYALGNVALGGGVVAWAHGPQASLKGQVAWVPLGTLEPAAATKRTVEGAPFAPDVDGGGLWWLEEGEGGVALYKAPLAGGDPVGVASGLAARSLDVVGGAALVTTEDDGGTVLRITPGGPQQPLATGIGDAWAVLGQGKDVWWLTVTADGAPQSHVWALPGGAGEPVELATAPGEPMDLALQGNTLVVALGASGSAWGLVAALPKGGGALTTLATGQSLTPCQLATNGTVAAFADCRPGGAVTLAPLAGGPTTALWKSPTKAPRGVAIDAAAVFWTTADAGGYGEIQGVAR